MSETQQLAALMVHFERETRDLMLELGAEMVGISQGMSCYPEQDVDLAHAEAAQALATCVRLLAPYARVYDDDYDPAVVLDRAAAWRERWGPLLATTGH